VESINYFFELICRNAGKDLTIIDKKTGRNSLGIYYFNDEIPSPHKPTPLPLHSHPCFHPFIASKITPDTTVKAIQKTTAKRGKKMHRLNKKKISEERRVTARVTYITLPI
jgi:hypothetical protein